MAEAITIESTATAPEVPTIEGDESFAEISKKLARFIIDAVNTPLSWEDLRSSKHMKSLQPLIDGLVNHGHHPATVAALVVLKGHFTAMETDDDCGINESRGLACELVAWQFVLALSEHEAMDYLLFELRSDSCGGDCVDEDDEETGLLSAHRNGHANGHTNGGTNGNANGNGAAREAEGGRKEPSNGEEFAEPFMNLNTLEMAAVSGAKKFLSQRAVQDVVNGIWSGEIVFWDTLTTTSVKRPRFRSKSGGDVWSRLRVPRYMKALEIFFFVCLLALFYVVSLQRVTDRVTVWEGLFYVFVVGFAFDELDLFVESGASFYSTETWAFWDLGIVLIGVAFFVLRMIGLATGHDATTEWAFSALVLQSLLLIPRIFSLLSLSPYYGSLVPALKEMGKQFIRFLGFALVIYLGFYSTFLLLARGHFPLYPLSITVLKAFFGAGVVGFDIANQVSPYLGLPVMIILVCFSNLFLQTAMMAHISASLRQVLDSSREEFLFVYTVYVLEASTSDKLTYFQPPFNLIIIILLRPVFWCVPQMVARKMRIALLKVTHAPFVAAIWAYERWETFQKSREAAERNALSFWFGNPGATTSGSRPAGAVAGQGQAAKDKKDNKATTAASNRKHTLRFSRHKVQVPAQLLQQASERPGRVRGPRATKSLDTATAMSTAGRPLSAVSTTSPAVQNGAPVASAAPAQNLDGATALEMMKMLKELSAQIEEIRSALVKHEHGPGPGDK